MPRLTRLHLMNIGHSNARMQDLRLELCDADGQPVDSTLWLRNGGGKSSILNLFFSLLNPNRRNFLGTQADQGDRALEDYVLSDDRAVVLAQWQLDTPKQTAKQWFWTGVFYEWHNEKLERVFFSAHAQAPLMRVEDFPFSDETGKRLTLRGFKQAWQNLLNKNAQLNGHEFESQQEWRQALEREARIDPELFMYQQRMNTREGGADELFRFKDVDQFIDFFLELTVPTDRGTALARNLKGFQDSLRERLEELQPSLALIDRLLVTVQPMRELSVQRFEHRRLLGEVRQRLNQLAAHIRDRTAAMNSLYTQIAGLEERARTEIALAQTAEQAQRTRMLMLQRYCLEQHLHQKRREHEACTQESKHAERDRLIWKAAIPWVELERQTVEIRGLQELIERQQQKLAPDVQAVREVARTLWAALSARVRTTQQSVLDKQNKLQTLENERTKVQESARDCRSAVVRSEEQSKQITMQLERASRARDKLQTTGVLRPTERIADALERCQGAVFQHEFDFESIKGGITQCRDEVEILDEQLNSAKGEQREAEAQVVECTRLLEEGLNAQESLLHHPVLARGLDVELHDPSVLNRTSLSLLRDHRSNVEGRMRELEASLAYHRDVLEYLQSHQRLPPTRDLRTVLRVLASHGVYASPGWTHLSQTQKREEARGFIARHPELMQGVLIRDAHFEKAKRVLQDMPDQLDSPVVIAPRSLAFDEGTDQAIFEARAAKRFVVGPSSDAHFDSQAAEREQQARELQAHQERSRRETIEQESIEWRDAIDELERFLEYYPDGWFTDRETSLLTARKRTIASVNRVNNLASKRHSAKDRLKLLEAQHDDMQQLSNLAKDHLRQLEAHVGVHGTDEATRELSETLMEQAQRQQQQAVLADGFERDAANLGSQIRSIESELRQWQQEITNDEAERKHLKYVEGNLPQIVSGSVDQLRDEYKRRADHLEQKNRGSQLQAKLKAAETARDIASERYGRERKAGIEDQDVRGALKGVSDSSERTVSEKLEEATERWAALRARMDSGRDQLKAAEERLSQHLQEHPSEYVQLSEDELALDVEQLTQRSEDARKASEAARVQRQTWLNEMQAHIEEKQQLSAQRDQARLLKDQLERSLENNETSLTDAIEPTSSAIWTAPSDEQLETQCRDLDKALNRATKRHAQLLEERQLIHQKFMQCLMDASFRFVNSLTHWQPEDLEVDVETLFRDLETRAQNIRDALAESEKHRELLIEQTLHVADIGIQMLKGLERHSKLADVAATGKLAKQRFLRIHMSATDSPKDQRERIGTLIDDITRERSVLDGLKLVQRAVRKLAQPFRVEILFPDIDSEARYIPITSLSKESGGERLTSAVLLYCALAQQRARTRGQSNDVSSVLLLDNPVGTASRAKFLELQRAVAQATNIQLIYATGVNDLEALHTMPNIVRLRNERRNEDHRLLEAVQIIRPEIFDGAATDG